MSWPLASFALVAGVLGAGWLAYERRRPPARLAAVVAVMAALTALGREAFAALPDVKPITAMTLVTGYALGPLPGFTVGALGILASNFMLGQGPYTPWQMAAWGGVGLLGSVLARIAGRDLGRLSLALASASAALVAKEVMNLYTWVLGASHTPAAFLLIAGQALPYDVTDVVASFLFALAFAPELAHLLARARARMSVHWTPSPVTARSAPNAAPPVARAGAGSRRGATRSTGLTTLVLSLSLLAAAGSLLACGSGSARALSGSRASSASSPLAPEVRYLLAAQNRDGGFGAAPGQASSELYTAWAALGLAAAGHDPAGLRGSGGRSVLDALRGEASALHGAGDLERTILALHACGASARELPGGDPVARLLRARDGDGSFEHLANLTAFAILALRAAGLPAKGTPMRDAAVWLARQQQSDGGFGFAQRGGASDVDDTAAALQALAAAGRLGGRAHRRTRAAAVGYLLHAQNLDGGFPQQAGAASNAQSTAWAIQGLLAAGVDPARVRRAGSRSPLAYLQTLVSPDGSVRYSRIGRQTPVWVTAQALTALARRPLPIAPAR